MATLKNILIVIATILWATACSSDILEDNGGNNIENGGAATLNVCLSDGDIATKAAGRETAELTNTEKNIQTLVIAVFEKSTGYRVGLKVLNQTAVKAAYDGKSTYIVNEIPCKEGEMIVCAAANVETDLFDGIYMHSTNEYQGDAANWLSVTGINRGELVKVNNGVKVTLKKGDVENVDISLTQLPARVDIMNITVKTEKTEATYNMTSMNATINNNMYVFNSYAFENIISESVEATPVEDSNALGSFYTYPAAAGKLKVNITGSIKAKRTDGTSFDKTADFSFTINQDLVSGKLYRANIIVNSNLELVEVTFTPLDWVEENIGVGLK